jgi:hypothetical protein
MCERMSFEHLFSVWQKRKDERDWDKIEAT